MNTSAISATGDNSVIQTTVHGLPFLCPGNLTTGQTCYDFKNNGGYEFSETRRLSLVLKPGQVVVDVGANIGYFTLLFAKMVGNSGKVCSFEPEPFSALLLRTNVERNNFNNSVEVFQVALGDTEGTSKLYLNPYNAGDHRTWSDGVSGPYERTNTVKNIPIKVTTLDKVLSNVPRIDVLKIDVQGDEERILQGAREIISRSSGMFLSIEYWPFGIIHSGGSVERFVNTLYELGFFVCICQAFKILPVNIEELYDSKDDEDPLNLLFRDSQKVANLWCFKGR